MHRVIHFELGASEPERAVAFYEKVFGWKVQRWEGPQPYWLVTTGPDNEPGINGGIQRYPDGLPRTINTIGVPSVDEFTAKITANGGKVALPKMAIPGVGYQAYFLDTEGNIFGIHQADPLGEIAGEDTSRQRLDDGVLGDRFPNSRQAAVVRVSFAIGT